MDASQLVQGSLEWQMARCGKASASRMADICAKTKTGYGASRANYLAEIVIERLTWQPAPSYESAAMIWGREQEPNARIVYEMRANVDVQTVGFVHHPSIALAGASPDGLVGNEGLLEIKCPNTSGHIETLLTDTISDKYIKQIQFQLACTERAWCDFVSYDPRMPERMQLYIRRIHRSDEQIAEIEKEVIAFLAEADAKIAALTERYGDGRKAA